MSLLIVDSTSSTGWQRLIKCLIFMGHFPQKSPIISDSFAESDPRDEAFYASSPPCSVHVCVCMCIYGYVYVYVNVRCANLYVNVCANVYVNVYANVYVYV